MKFSILLVSAFLTMSSSFAEDAKKQEMMQKWKEYSTPGEQHKILAQAVGNWTYTSKSWESAEAKPEETKGTSSAKMLLGGRYLQQEVKGTAMGQPFEGISLTGYDNLKKRFDTIWMDSMATGIMKGQGSYDASTKTLMDKGEYTCPMKPNETAEYRSDWKFIDKNNMTFTMYGKGMTGDKEFKMMEMVYKRK